MSEITMYGAEWCGDCRRSKKFLDANNVKLDSISIKVYALKTTLFVRDIPSQKPHKFAHNALMIIIF